MHRVNLNICTLRMLEETFSLGAAHLVVRGLFQSFYYQFGIIWKTFFFCFFFVVVAVVVFFFFGVLFLTKI